MVDFSGCLGSSTLEGDMEAIETTSSGTQISPAWLQLSLGQEQPIFKISERRKCTKYRQYRCRILFYPFYLKPLGICHENHSGSRCQVRALCRPFLCSWLKLLVEHPSCAGGRSENIVRPVPLLR